MKSKYTFAECQYAREVLRKMRSRLEEMERVVGLLDNHSTSYPPDEKFADIIQASTEMLEKHDSFLKEINELQNKED